VHDGSGCYAVLCKLDGFNAEIRDMGMKRAREIQYPRKGGYEYANRFEG
jgi:hypothetical protein